jgi:hypothetical protein
MGDEMYDARDLRIAPVDSTDPELRTDFRVLTRIESPFHSGKRAAASP